MVETNQQQRATFVHDDVQINFGFGEGRLMLELIILRVLASHIADRARQNGKSRICYVLVLVGLWFAGRDSWDVYGDMLTSVSSSGEKPNLLVVVCVRLELVLLWVQLWRFSCWSMVGGLAYW